MPSSSDYVDDERFDGLYLNVANTTRGIEPLLDTVFSFLRRKTDFLAGPPGSDQGSAAAVQKVQEVLQKHVDIYERSQKKAKKSTQTKQKKTVEKKPEKKEDVIEMSQDGGFDVSSAEQKTKNAPDLPVAAATPPTSTAPAETSSVPSEPKKEAAPTQPPSVPDDDNRGPPPVGNGGTVDGKYVWTQILAEVNINVPVPDGTRGRDLNVSIAKKHLKVGLRSKPGEWIIDAPLTKAIICDDSFWTVEDGNRLSLNLQKLNQMEWWDSVCEGHPKINIRDIQPESSSVSDLDGETRKTVEKMMFDQRQKALGLPSSDEQKKLDMLENFKKQHPEMDFSNAKFS